MYRRHLFQFSDTGTETLVGSPFSGEVLQYRYVRQSGDTGGNIEIALDIDQSDTGMGWLIASHGLQPQLVKALRQPQHGADGAPDPADTGAAFGVPIVSNGDRLRVRRTATAVGAMVGRLYVWTRD